MRLIDVDAAIDAITEYGSEDTIYMSVAELKRRIEHLPSAQPKQQWIPVSERLPENDDKVLITHSHGVSMAWWNGRCWAGAKVKKYFTAKAWMPLPEPYQEGGAE